MATQSDKTTDSGAEAPAGVMTTEGLVNGRLPESGPSDTEKSITLTSPSGSKVSAPERMADALKAQGYKRG